MGLAALAQASMVRQKHWTALTRVLHTNINLARRTTPILKAGPCILNSFVGLCCWAMQLCHRLAVPLKCFPTSAKAGGCGRGMCMHYVEKQWQSSRDVSGESLRPLAWWRVKGPSCLCNAVENSQGQVGVPLGLPSIGGNRILSQPATY